MVTCSELMTCVATKSNSFHVWGSRSVIQSPLTLLLGKKQFKRSNCIIIIIIDCCGVCRKFRVY